MRGQKDVTEVFMKGIIFSDSHGRTEGMTRVLRMHPDADVVFFLGDGIRDIEGIRQSFPDHTYFAVRGNCDFTSVMDGTPIGKTDEVVLERKKIVFTHGDLYSVKYTVDRLSYLAEERGADVVLFGHTHEPYLHYESGDHPFYLFNPGSIGEPRDGEPSFGVLTIRDGEILLSHGEI